MSSRESELYKDKVEVSLDGRQIFYLFFGGATIVGVVFVLGVLVGRRVEARGHVDRARTHATADPLAALDRLEAGGDLSFRGALAGKGAPTTVETTIALMEQARTGDGAKDKRADKAVKSEDKAAKEQAAKEQAAKEQAAKEQAAKEQAAKEDKAAKDKVAKEEKAAKEAAKAAAKQAVDLEDEPVTQPAKAEAKAEPKAEEPKARFTLQLSSFQDKTEAEAFLATVRAQGFQAKITQAEVEGRGTFYRVRMGTYRSMEAATTAKAELEKSINTSASIMRL